MSTRVRAEGLSSGQGIPAGEVKKSRVSSNQLPTVDSSVPGVKLIIAHGANPDILRRTTGELVQAARDYVAAYGPLGEAKAAIEPAEAEIRRIVRETDGLRGVEIDGEFRLPVSVPVTVVWDRAKMKQGTGKHYPQVVTGERVTLEIDLDPHLGIEPATFLAITRLVLDHYGSSREDAVARTKMKVDLDVNEKLLDQLEETGVVMLFPGTRTEKRGTPSINKPAFLRKEPQSGQQE
jgi:hypothetical protein